MGHICSFMNSEDLLNLRLVNHSFQEEITKLLQRLKSHKYIVLKTEERVQELLCTLMNRKFLELLPFLFHSNFEVSLNLDVDCLETLGATIGQHVKRYSIRSFSPWDNNTGGSMEMGRNVIKLLSHSPQLMELKLNSPHELYVSQNELIFVPSTFPNLNVIGISGKYSEKALPGSPHPVIELLLGRARRLKRVKIPMAQRNLSLKILRFLVQNRPYNLPSFSSESCWRINTNTFSYFQEIMGMNLKFTDITISLEELSQNDTLSVSRWLEAQASSLKYLCINLFLQHNGVTLLFSSLPKLKDLTIRFPFDKDGRDFHKPILRPIEPLLGNPFPALQKFRLDRYRESCGLFETCCLTSVHELCLYSHRTPLTVIPWSIAFPNLTSLHIEFDLIRNSDFRTTLACILTYFTTLIHLDLDITRSYSQCTEPGHEAMDSNFSYWDLLTGRACESLRKNSSVQIHGTTEAPRNGICRIPSLRNMTCEFVRAT